MEGSSDVTSLFFPLAGSGCLPNTLRCSDWDVARQPHHPRCCSASGTQVGAYVDLTLKEQQCWGVEGGLPGKILDWAEAQGARPYLKHHRHHTETPWETAKLVLFSQLNAWFLKGSNSSQQQSAVKSFNNPDCSFLGGQTLYKMDLIVWSSVWQVNKSKAHVFG